MKHILNAGVTDLSALGGLPLFGVSIIISAFLAPSLALQLVTAVVLSYGLTIIIRLIYYKDRPKKRSHSNFLTSLDASSFPSLHTMRAAILAVLLAKSELMLAVLLVFASGVGFARFKLQHHDRYDVLGGFCIGVVLAFLVRGYL